MSKTETQTPQKHRPAAPKKPAEVPTRVYCGPTIKGVAKQYSVYQDGVPEALAQEITKSPIIGSLLVPLGDFAKTRTALGDPTSAESIFFNKILKNL